MTYDQILATMKKLRLVPQDYDDTKLREATPSLKRSVIVANGGSFLYVNGYVDEDASWFTIEYSCRPHGLVYIQSAPTSKGRATQPWTFTYGGKTSITDSFTSFGPRQLALLFRRPITEMTPDALGDLLSLLMPREELFNPESPFMDRLIDEFLGWYAASLVYAP